MVEPRRGAHQREPSGSKQAAPRTAATEALDELILTLNPATHDVVKVERLGRAGVRTELSEHECTELAGDDELDDLVVTVQEAYEAGVMKGLDQPHDYEEADEDLVIWQLLLDRPSQVGPLRRDIRRALLHRLLLRRLLRRRLPYPPTSAQQRRKPNAEATAERTRNGSASKI